MLGDAARLERAIANILGNAIKYSRRGTTITASLACQEDHLGRWALLGVADEGVGIPAADLPRVFERFYRASNVADVAAGTGLGLAGVRQIVQQHGGHRRADERGGDGHDRPDPAARGGARDLGRRDDRRLAGPRVPPPGMPGVLQAGA